MNSSGNALQCSPCCSLAGSSKSAPDPEPNFNAFGWFAYSSSSPSDQCSPCCSPGWPDPPKAPQTRSPTSMLSGGLRIRPALLQIRCSSERQLELAPSTCLAQNRNSGTTVYWRLPLALSNGSHDKSKKPFQANNQSLHPLPTSDIEL
jgi:hypothetical protein